MSAEAASPPPGAIDARCVVFRAGGERFALALAAVREVVLPQPPYARVPRSGAPVRGAMNLRGRVIPVVDLAALLGLAAPPLADRDGRVVILEGTRPGLGLLVAAVMGVEPLAVEGTPGVGLARGLAAGTSGAVTVLDAPALAAAAEAHFGAR